MKKSKSLLFFIVGIVFIGFGVNDLIHGTFFMNARPTEMGLSIKSPFVIIGMGVLLSGAAMWNIFRKY